MKKLIDKCLSLLKRRDIILYLVFGVLTTLVDYAVTFILYKFDSINVHVADTIAWVCAVLFAFVTNRIWVFESDKKGFLPILSELIPFAGGRVLTLLLQEGIVFLFYDLLHINKYIVKIGASVLVVIINYFLSRFIFKKKKASDEAENTET